MQRRRLLGLPVLLLLPWLAWAEGAPVEGDCSQNPIIGFAGEDIVLKPEVVGIPSYITWKKEENIVYEWSRGNSDPSNGSLILKSLSQSHGGVYTAEIQIGTKIEYKHFCLEVIEPPVLSCSDRSDDIQVNCTSPPRNGSHNLPVSYSWEARGEIFDHRWSITLQKNENLPEKITCIVSIYNVKANDSIVLSTCLTKGPDQERHRPGLWGFLVIPVLAVIGWLGFRRWKKGNGEDVPLTETPDDSKGVLENLEDGRREGRSKHWFLRDNKKGKSQEDPGNDEGVPLNETPDDSKGVLENSEDDRREGNADVPLNEMLTKNGSRRVSEDSKDNRSKGNDEGVPLKETPDDSKGVLENLEDGRREEGNDEDVPLTETPDDSKGVLENSKDGRREEGNDEDVPLTETPDDSKGVLENSKEDRREGNHIELEKGED